LSAQGERGGGGWFSGGSKASSNTRAMPVPPPPRPGMQQGRQGPGLMGQMAATAGGVAIGSAMGHYLGNRLTNDKGEPMEANQQNEVLDQNQMAQQQMQPCEFEWKQFLECSQKESNLAQCQVFNDIFKQCQTRLAEGH